MLPTDVTDAIIELAHDPRFVERALAWRRPLRSINGIRQRERAAGKRRLQSGSRSPEIGAFEFAIKREVKRSPARILAILFNPLVMAPCSQRASNCVR
jgi:hypothetical protein